MGADFLTHFNTLRRGFRRTMMIAKGIKTTLRIAAAFVLALGALAVYAGALGESLWLFPLGFVLEIASWICALWGGAQE